MGKKRGTDAWKRYNRYMKGTTLGHAVRLGAAKGDLRFDARHSYLKFLPPLKKNTSTPVVAKKVVKQPAATLKAIDSLVVSIAGKLCRVPFSQKVAYKTPNPKVKGSDSWKRYAKYMKAQTLGASLKKAARHVDVRHDVDRGFLTFPRLVP